MGTVLVGKPTDPQIDQSTLNGMFRLRDEVFNKRLGWNLKSQNGHEYDHYDALHPVYMVVSDKSHLVAGCWRLLPTTGPYMLKDTFPQLLRGQAAPVSPDIWEISRFVMVPTSQQDLRQVNLSALTFEMLRRAVSFADQQGIRRYVFVTSVALERLLRKIGLPLHRFGDGEAQLVGQVRSAACWIDVTEGREAALGEPSTTPAYGEAA